jgi:hypothetical protein
VNSKICLCGMSVDQIISLALERERQSMEFYRLAIDEVGPDARTLLENIHTQHVERIRKLERLKNEITELRDLTAAIAD